MKLSPLKLFIASFAFSTFALAGCAADATAPSEDDASEDVGVSQDELSARSKQFVGSFKWDAATSGGFVDFQSLTLNADGSYTAMVDSGLVDPGVRCVRFPCTLAEEGKWTTVKSYGKLRIKVDPAGVKPARSYIASLSGIELTLTRFGASTKLFKQSTVTCANVRCAAGTHCEMKGINGGSIPVCVNDAPSCATMLCAPGSTCEETPSGGRCVPMSPCVKTGCSGQICADQHRVSTCEFRPEYACYQTAACERQANGQCGWTQTPALTSCLASH